MALGPGISRTLISLPETELRWLKRLGKRRGVSMAFIVREAVAEYRIRVETTDRESSSALERTAGRWKGRKLDAVDYVVELRNEWGD